MSRSLHVKKDGSAVVKDGNGKIVDNLPGPAALRGPVAVPGRPSIADGAAANAETGSLAAMYSTFEGINGIATIKEQIQALDAKIADTDANLATIYPKFVAFETARLAAAGDPDTTVDEPTVALDSLVNITVGHKFAPGSQITIREAVDLYRLEKAVAREERTRLRIDQDAKNGIHLVNPYGDAALGTSQVEGWNPPNSKAWLLARTNGIGGSDKIGYLDENNKFVSYDSVDKTNYVYHMLRTKSPAAIAAIEDGPDSIVDETQIDLPLRIGNALERTVQYDFARAHPEYAHLEDKYTRTSLGRPHHRFNPDGVLQDKSTGEYGVFEAKTARSAAAFDAAAAGYKAQCLHNCAASGLSFAVLVADIEGESEQRVTRLDFSPQELQEYRDAVDRAWYLYKPRSDAKNPAPARV